MIKNYIKNNYFILIPITITFILYFNSLFFDFRNFDEDVIIKNVYVNKTFSEYIERYLLLHFNGATNAQGFTFSEVKNTHVSLFGMPLFYLLLFLSKGKPLLFHIWGLFLHLTEILLLSKFIYSLTKKKEIALFTSLLWGILPTNVEPVIWATNAPHLVGGVFYFFTLYKISEMIEAKDMTSKEIVFIALLTLTQILFAEHTITISMAILLTILLKCFLLDKTSKMKNYLKAFFLPPVLITISYWLVRNLLISKASSSELDVSLVERILFLSPQIFFHQIKLIFLPLVLTIDQIDHIKLDNIFLGSYHLLSVFIFLLYISIGFLSLKNKNSFFISFGLFMGLLIFIPYLQIIPFYSLCGERYNHFSSAFIIFSFIILLNKIRLKQISISILLLLVFLSIGRSSIRICEWENSKTLYESTIRNTKSSFKKGVWLYNLSLNDTRKKLSLLNQSIKYLEKHLNEKGEKSTGIVRRIFTGYGLDKDSLNVKAILRIATDYGAIGDKEKQKAYLLKVLNYPMVDKTQKSVALKNLGTLYFQEGKLNEALDLYKKSYEIIPTNSLSFALAVCYIKLGDINNYEKFLKESTNKPNLENAIAFRLYGEYFEKSKNDFINAEKFYKIATILENKPDPYNLLANLYLKELKVADALTIVRRGLHSFPDDPSLIYLHGAILINLGNITEGKNNLKKVINLKATPDDIRLEASNILKEIK